MGYNGNKTPRSQVFKVSRALTLSWGQGSRVGGREGGREGGVQPG